MTLRFESVRPTLGRLGIGAAYERLRHLLLHDPDLEVRIAVAFAMGELGESGDSRVCKTWSMYGRTWDKTPKQQLRLFVLSV